MTAFYWRLESLITNQQPIKNLRRLEKLITGGHHEDEILSTATLKWPALNKPILMISEILLLFIN